MTRLSGGTAGRRHARRGLLAALGLLGVLSLLSGCATTGGDSAPASGPDLADIEDAVPRAEPKSKYGNPKSYVVFGKRYYTKASADGHVERGLASWYGKKFHGRRTSSGERYDMHAMTAAHKSLPLPTYVEVTNLNNGRSTVVKVNDRGPFHGERVIDLSYAAARKLGMVRKGTAMVEVRAVDPRKPRREAVSEDLFVDSDSGASGERRGTPAIQVASAASAPNPGAVAAARQPAPKPAVADAKPAASRSPPVYLQVGAFGSRTNAEQMRRRLVDQLAENVLVRTFDGSKAPLYKVHVGPLDSRGKADHVSEKLASLGLDNSLVVEE
jgi:rare lipoprotein A